MTALVLLIAFMLMGNARAIVELDCSDNATCIDHMAKEVIRSLRHHRAVRLFDVLTIEPLATRQARSNDGLLSRIMGSHAFSFDWNDFTFRFTLPQDGSDHLDLEVYEERSVKEVADPSPKKSSSKVEEEKEEDKAPKGIRRRKHKKKVLQAVFPLLFGMKSAGMVMFAFALVTVLTLKAFVASKLALGITVGMAMKKLYESYSTGVGLQNHPYLYSQYPIDFPSASSHAYSVSGVSPQFASQEMYNPTGLGTHSHTHEILQQNDASAQQSQQAPTLQLVNSTRAAERWDGKSKLLKFLEPIVDSFKTIVNPIANVFYDAMPATFRGLNTDVKNADVSTAKSYEPEPVEDVKKPREILVAQPRNIAQRKAFRRYRTRPKKYTELKIDLDRLKHNKDLHDYMKTKKYKFNYPHTYYYPRIKYFVNPNSFFAKPNNTRLVPYRKVISSDVTNESTTVAYDASDWKPIIFFNHTVPQINDTKPIQRIIFHRKPYTKTHSRTKRHIDMNVNTKHESSNLNVDSVNKDQKGRGLFGFFESFFISDPVTKIIDRTNEYTKTMFKSSKKPKEPPYYTAIYDFLMMSLDLIEGFFNVEEAVGNHYLSKSNKKVKKNKRNTRKRLHRNHKIIV